MYSLDRLVNNLNLHRRFKPSGFEALTLNYVISQVAAGMLASFGVLFIYELGGSFERGLLMVLLFFGLERAMVALVIPGAANLISKTGYRWMMFIGLTSLALKAMILAVVTVVDWRLLMPALALGGVSTASYYLGYHGLFLDDNDDERIGEQIGIVTMAGRVSLIVAPILAGFLIEQYGFAGMFMAVMVLLVVSMAPLLMMPRHRHEKQEYQFGKVRRFLNTELGFRRSVFWWHMENGIQTYFWPIFLFLVIGSHIKFGAINSLVMALSSLAVYWSGRFYDRRPLRRGRLAATGLVVLSYGLRFSARSIVTAGLADGLNRLASPFWWMKIRRKALLSGEKVKPLVFAAAWEWMASLGYLSSLIIGYGLLITSNSQWLWLALVAGVSVIISARRQFK